ncbi:MAG: helix-turn-helix transcriptional regulator [Proteobacteria bacterium]|nr:helix-turn-helix transcriptional regulator [Pseudomonadota bacterium]
MTNSRSRDTESSPHEVDRIRLGARLREIRKAQSLTLRSLSDRSGVAVSTLSKIELGQISVSYAKLTAVAHGLAADISDLFYDRPLASLSGRPTVVKSTLDGSPGYDGPSYDYSVLAADFPHKKMTPIHASIPVRTQGLVQDYVRHIGEEFTMVLSGRVRVEFETGEAVDLNRGESAYFDSGVGHRYVSMGKDAARIVIVMAEDAATSSARET